MSETFYSAFAEVLSVSQSSKDDLAALLDPETGFAPRLRQVCREQLADLAETRDIRVSPEEVELLRLEENTWGLVQALMSLRKTASQPLSEALTLLRSNPYTPTASIAHAIIAQSPFLTELIVVREWLQETAPFPPRPEAATGYWRFTKFGVMQALRTRREGGLVKDMDPDAIGRDGNSLAADDTSYEKSLSQALYAFIRAGKLDDAVDLCRKAHQPWRAASIRGSLLFQWSALTTEPVDTDAMNADDSSDEEWTGNPRRRLWRETCTRAALNTSLSDGDRLLYAALAPSPETSSVLASAARTWADWVWARVSVLCEERLNSGLEALARTSFWEGVALDAGAANGLDGNEDVDEWMSGEEEWEREAVAALASLKDVRVLDGPSADHAYHVCQLNIILDRTDVLLNAFGGGLQQAAYDNMSAEYNMMTRFFAHLCLFLRLIDIPVPPEATQVILEAYLQVLETSGQRDLIALYAGALGENAVERYALFLTSLLLSASLEERRTALSQAREHGLDVRRVAIATAERTIEHAFEELPQLDGPLPPVVTFSTPASDNETLLIRSIEWTTFMESTYNTALEQANVIFRYLLASGRVHVAKLLLTTLPLELASISGPVEQATEYLQYRQFFNAWECLNRIVECEAMEGPGMNRETHKNWLEDYESLIDDARKQVVKILMSEWLVSDVEDGDHGDRRRRELIRIRQIYIPELITRLHAHLYMSRHKLPQNLAISLQLANVVADSRYKLYEDFVNQDGRRLGDYLDAVRQAVLGGLDRGGSDPFKVMSY